MADAFHPFTGEELTAESLADSYLQALQHDDAGLRWLLDQEVAKDPTLARVRNAVADEYVLRRASRAARTLIAASLFMGCAELPVERGYKVEYGAAATSLKVELAGAVDRLQADEALRRRAAELGCVDPTVNVASIAAKIEEEKTTTTIAGTYVCGRAM